MPTETFGEDRGVDAVKREDFLRHGLVLGEHHAVGAGTCVPPPDQVQKRANLEVGRVIVRKGLRQVEDEVAIRFGEAEQALLGTVQLVEDRFVAKLRQRVRNFLLDFFLVERPDDRRFVGGRGLLLGLVNEHAVVENEDAQGTHLWIDERRLLN